MTNFQTIVSINLWHSKIGLSDVVFTIGSCFSDAMGSRLQLNKVQAHTNPFGVVYNPFSIHKILDYTISNQGPAANTYLQTGDVFANYDFHSEISSLEEHELRARLSEIVAVNHAALKQSRWLIITFGTAWVYERMETGEVVANCHKAPSSLFTKRLLAEGEIIQSFNSIYTRLKELTPDIKIVLTVSPVRHVKDTLELNSVSKAVLRTACHQICREHINVDYFPAYEIMIDELRDYRFYKADLLHPTEVAEDHIWNRFSDRYFDITLKTFIHEWSGIRRALNHRPFHPASVSHQLFLRETLKKLEELKSVVDVEKEIDLLKSQLVGYTN